MFTPNKTKSTSKTFNHKIIQPSNFKKLKLQTEKYINKGIRIPEKENKAKDSLVKIGESSLASPDAKKLRFDHPLIDSWGNNNEKLSQPKLCSKGGNSHYSFSRNVRSVTTNIKSIKDSIEEGNTYKLKETLKKLDSPQKCRRSLQKIRQDHSQILQNLVNRRRGEMRVSQILRLKQSHNSKTTTSINKIDKISSSLQNTIRRIPSGQCMNIQGSEHLVKLFNSTMQQRYKNMRIKQTIQ